MFLTISQGKQNPSKKSPSSASVSNAVKVFQQSAQICRVA